MTLRVGTNSLHTTISEEIWNIFFSSKTVLVYWLVIFTIWPHSKFGINTLGDKYYFMTVSTAMITKDHKSTSRVLIQGMLLQTAFSQSDLQDRHWFPQTYIFPQWKYLLLPNKFPMGIGMHSRDVCNSLPNAYMTLLLMNACKSSMKCNYNASTIKCIISHV